MLPHDEAGSGQAVVLLHAGIADRRMWRDQLEPFAAAGYRTIAVDLPGYGDAELPEEPQAPWADVLQTLDELAIERAALVGNSFGGAVALRAALVAPERVSALVLISAGPPWMKASRELLHVWHEEQAALDQGDVEAAVRVVVDAWTQPGAPSELRALIATMQRRAFELQHGEPPGPLVADPIEDDAASLSRITTPTLVAAGDRDMTDFIQGAQFLADSLPDARHETIRGAGHLAPLEAPEAFRSLTLGFLAEKV
ncbi:MAG TPA: alpha/beta fold hydrolase [Solirubrobacteraceae bacterium]|nr:alpha/beta fold hydrolase [Solirubrobacteraceae bacterium]